MYKSDYLKDTNSVSKISVVFGGTGRFPCSP